MRTVFTVDQMVFLSRFWTVKEQKADEITFEIEDADLEQGFPGNAVVDVTFKVTEENALAIIYNAKADKTTTFNMTNHSYFNLNGHASGSVYTHTLQINAEHYTPVKDSKAIPTGEIAPVEGTPFDFTELSQSEEISRQMIHSFTMEADMITIL